jgi:hypothetical protein
VNTVDILTGNNRRVQDTLDPISTVRLGLKKDEDDDKEGLINSHWDDDKDHLV